MYVAPPMRMGAWSMARVLRQRIEYYIYLLCEKHEGSLSEKAHRVPQQNRFM